MAKRCKYIYKGKTYSKEEFMALLAGGEYENILAEYDQAPEVEVKEGREVVDTVKTFKAKSSVGGKFNVNLFADLTDEQGKTILDKLREEGYVVDNADIFSFADSDNVFTMVPDNKMVGDLSYGKDKEGKDRVVLQGNGGIYFAVKFNNDGTFWASTPQIANSIIKQINAAIDKNGSPAYVVVNKGSNRKVLSSVDGMIAAVDTIAYMVEDGDIPLSVFRNEMSSAIKKSGYTGKDLFPMNISAKDMHKSIKDLFMKAEFTSFEKRKEVVTNLIKNIFDKKSNKDLVNFESLSEKLGFPLKNKEDIIDSFGKIQEEGFISEVPSQSAYAVIEIPSKLKIEDESSKDPSERRHIAYAGVMKTEDGQRVKVHMLKDRLNWRDFMTDSKGTPLSEMEEKSALGKAGHGQVPFIKAGIKAKASKGVGKFEPLPGAPKIEGKAEAMPEATQDTDALKDVESTAKALEGVDEKEKLAVKEINDRFVKNTEDGKQESENTNIILKRLSSEEEQGRRRGGKANVDATIITARVQESGDKNGWSERKIKQNQENELRTYAEQQGLWVGDVSELTNDPDAKGAESLVMYSNDGKSVEKYTSNKIHHRDWSEFFDRIAIHNTLFPETAYEVVGFGEIKGETVVKLKQPLVHAEREATASEIIQDMENRGFKSLGLGRFHNKETGVFVGDLFYGNVVVSKRGNLLYIDPVTKLDSDEASVKTTRNKFPLEISNTEAPAEALGSGVKTRAISQAYHKAKADGSNPELVQAVEDLLGQPTTLQEGVKGQAITDPTLLFKKSQELFDKISDAAGGSKKRSSAEERRKFMDDNPDIKYIDDNMAYIYKQIEDNNLGKKEGNCPL